MKAIDLFPYWSDNRALLAEATGVLEECMPRKAAGMALGIEQAQDYPICPLELQAGDALDGSTITRWELVPYTEVRTYDLLPAGATGYYWANGILLASTLSA